MPHEAHRITLARRPKGEPTPDDFGRETVDLPEPSEGEVLVRTIWLSLDPYMRGRMDDAKSYADPVPLGGVMEGEGVAEVIESRHEGFAKGDIVAARTGWASAAVVKGEGLRKVDPSIAPIQTALGVLGMPGLTAFVGVDTVGKAQKGETIVVSAATGAVGTVAGQLAKARGLRAVGVAGGAEKCAYAVDELGYDACIDHHAEDFAEQLAAAVPDGIDVYIEHVGGKTLSAVIPLMNQNGRIPVIGMIAWYNGQNLDQALPLPKVWRTVLTKRLTIQGMLVFDHADRRPDFEKEVGALIRDGRLTYRETVADGLDNAPEAFIEMLKGGNFGKQLVRVGPDP
ncbi:NADP-dependent oxidoreductase [Oceaniglobus roseus]|uniref:NADP-dependent oxidoreductase n=1 Tax=Oceaniglobus roseus TaxID=1737570 RepID=UPI000C7F099C|nr:NADP-dependent oxidoreductase [Kandeliimicrobium roseum]